MKILETYATFPRHRGRRHPAAFSLTELLTVIAILAILVALLFPFLKDARERARTVGCLNSLKEIGIASNAFAADNDGRFPAVDRWRTRGEWVTWGSLIRPYLNNQGPGVVKRDSVICPSADPAVTASCYTLNQMIIDYVDFLPVPIARFEHPLTTIYVYDSDHGWTSATKAEANPEKGSSSDPFTHRHSERTNILFVDGHVGMYTYQEAVDAKPNWWLPDARY